MTLQRPLAARSGRSRLARILAFDPHILGTLILRGWSLGAGVLTMLLVPLALPKEHQGYYFTFASLIALQVFFELGFNHVISQIVSHELALHGQAGTEEARQRHAARLQAVSYLTANWYRPMAIAFALIAFGSGTVFFLRQGVLPWQDWLAPWLLVCLGSSLNLYVSPLLAVAEGAGRVDRVARMRLIQSIAGYGLMWALLLAHSRLWAAAAVPCVAGLISWRWLADRRRLGLPQVLVHPQADGAAPASADAPPALTWRRDVLPLQWRIALSWVSGYFIFQAFTPFLFAHQGAVAAGRAGLALAACTAILGLGMSWVNATSPRMSAAIARGDRTELKHIYSRVLVRSLGFTALALALLIGAAVAGQHAGMRFAERIADPITLTCLGLTTLANCAIGAMAIFMRCHKEEPMLVPSVVMALLTLTSVSWGSTVNAQLPFVLYSAVTLCIALPWSIAIFLRYWRRPN